MPVKIPVHAIVHARMSSGRLPGKVLRMVQGIPLLGHLVDRLEHCDSIDGLVIATSCDPLDDAISDYAARRGIRCFRGSLDDVAGRVVDAAMHHGIEHLVRLSGDSPMLDPAVVSAAVDVYRRERPDLATNVQQRTFPKGQSVEILPRKLLEDARRGGLTASDREHVTTHFYRHPDKYTIRNITYPGLRGETQLSVDTEADLVRFERIISRLGAPYWRHGLEDILAAFDEIGGADEQ
jgi:hypothetical protein